MLFFLKGISNAICDLDLYTFLEGTNSPFTWNWKVPFKYLKIFVATHFSTVPDLEY